MAGYAVIEVESDRVLCIAYGCIKLNKTTLPQRLHSIFNEIQNIVETHQPTEAAIEEVFVYKNVDSALKLGQARGAAITALASQGLDVFEYNPTAIKKAVVGRGNADKTQIQHMMKAIFQLDEEPQSDAADALAIALCHANTQSNLIQHTQRVQLSSEGVELTVEQMKQLQFRKRRRR